MAENNVVYSNFNFCGDIVIPKKNGSWIRREKFKKDFISINFGIKVGTNVGYVTAKDFKNDEIKTKDTNKKDMNVSWIDRFDEDIVKSVASYRKFVVNLGERREFITAWDMIEYLEGVLETYDKPIVVTGRFALTPGTGKNADKVYREFQIQGVYAAKEKDVPRLVMNADLYYDKNSMDKSSLKDDGKIYMNCYTPQYVNSDEGAKMFELPVVFNTAVLDMNKDTHKKIYDYKMRYLDTKSGNPVHMNWLIGVVNGAEEIPFSMDTLTDRQREQVELGISKLDDFRPRGSIYGNKQNELRLIKPILEGEFADSKTAEPSGYTASKFEKEIYSPSKDETIEDMEQSASNPAAKPVVQEDDDDGNIDNLF